MIPNIPNQVIKITNKHVEETDAMKKLKKVTYMKIILYIASIMLFGWWGLTHIFFKEFYFNQIFNVAFNITHNFDNESSEMIGVLCIALAYGAFLAARNPLKNMNLVKVLIVASFGASLVFVYNTIIGRTPVGLLINAGLILAMVVAIIILYPEKR